MTVLNQVHKVGDAHEAVDLGLLDRPQAQRPRPVGLEHGVVEALWSHVAERDDWQPLHDHVAAIRGSACGP